MKVLINLIVLAAIIGGAVYFYEQNRDELNQTLDDVKNASVESVTEAVVEKVKNMDPKDLMDLAMENKELLQEVMEKNNISLDNIDLEALQKTLDEQGINLEEINLEDAGIAEKLKDIVNSAEK